MKDDWGLCVGVGTYLDDAHLDGLPGAAWDAERFYNWLIDEAAVPETQCELVQSPLPPEKLDQVSPTPTAERIEKWFQGLIRIGRANRAAGQGFVVGRRLWLYLAGHGLDFGGANDTGLLTADSLVPDWLIAIVGKAWAEHFRLAKAFEEVILLMDCCRNQVRKVEPRNVPVPPSVAQFPARHFYGLAVTAGTSAREVEVPDGPGGTTRPGGQFTFELLNVLRARESWPLTASQLGGQLYTRMQARGALPDIQWPQNPNLDFVICEATPRPAPAPHEPAEFAPHEAMHAKTDGILLIGDDVPATEAIASFLRDSHREVRVMREHTFDSTRNHPISDFKPVIYSKALSAGHDLAAVPHAQSHETDTTALAAARVVAAVEKTPVAKLSVQAADELARLQVASERGDLLGEGIGSLSFVDLPHGKYTIRAAIGDSFESQIIELTQDRVANIPPLVLNTPFPLDNSRLWSAAERKKLAKLSPGDDNVFVMYRGLTAAPKLTSTHNGIDEKIGRQWHCLHGHWPPEAKCSLLQFAVGKTGQLAISLPVHPWLRTEAYILGDQSEDVAPLISVRLVPKAIALGAPLASDRFRENLVAHLQRGSTPDIDYASERFHSQYENDPIAILLGVAAELSRQIFQPQPVADSRPAFLRLASKCLCPDNTDLALLRGDPTVRLPPLLAEIWRKSIQLTQATVAEGMLADVMCGRILATEPWLTWDPSEEFGKQSWLRSVAAALWPGWNTDPEPQAALDLKAAAVTLAADEKSVLRRAYKSPPVERLVKASRIAFVGATHDQLPAAIATAFALRDKRKWEHLAVWFLEDENLLKMTSDGRSGTSLLRARGRAEPDLQRLLAQVANHWTVSRYRIYELDSQWYFASLWDWDRPGGYVHISPYEPGQDVRTTESINLTWPENSAAPPPRFAQAAKAYEQLSATRQ